MCFGRLFVTATIYLGILSACGDVNNQVAVPSARVDRVNEKTVPFFPLAGPTVYRFAKISNGAYFYTGSGVEAQTIINQYPDFRYEGAAFEQGSSQGGTPVYRFANLNNGGYFYTGSSVERDIVLRDYPHMRFEGSTFSVANSADTAAQPVYRLANLVNGAYLYTLSAAERDYAVSLGIWRSEGTSFKAPSISPLANKSWKKGAKIVDGSVLQYEVGIDDAGVATVAYFKNNGARNVLYVVRGTPSDTTSGINWSSPVIVDLDSNDIPLSKNFDGLQVSVAPNGNVAVAWNALDRCTSSNSNLPTVSASKCSVTAGAFFSIATGTWSRAQRILETPMFPSGITLLRINNRGDVALLQADGILSSLQARVSFRSASSGSLDFQTVVYSDAEMAVIGLEMDQSGNLVWARVKIDFPFSNSQLSAYRGNVQSGFGSEEIVSAPLVGPYLPVENGRPRLVQSESGSIALIYSNLSAPGSVASKELIVSLASSDRSVGWTTSIVTGNRDPSRFLLKNWVVGPSSFAFGESGQLMLSSYCGGRISNISGNFTDEKSAVGCSRPGDDFIPFFSDDSITAADRGGSSLTVVSGFFGPERWLAFDSKRNALIYDLVPTTPTTGQGWVLGTKGSSFLVWEQGKSALSKSGRAVLVYRAGLDTLPTEQNPAGVVSGNILNMFAFYFSN
jgi:Repeat of unknown function (DUF5648)